MVMDKFSYPEIIMIDGIEHKGKRKLSTGQLLIPYTQKPRVGVGDVITHKSGKRDNLLKVMEVSFAEGGSLGVGTDHPHLLTIKAVNTAAQPTKAKKKPSTIRVVSIPEEKLKKVSPSAPSTKATTPQPVKKVAKRPEEEKTETLFENNKHGFERCITTTYLKGKIRQIEVEETLASVPLPAVDAFRSSYPVGVSPTSARIVNLIRRSATNVVDGRQTTICEYFHTYQDLPFLSKLSEETFIGDVLFNLKTFHVNGQIKENYEYLQTDPKVVKCVLFRPDGVREKELTTWYRKDGTKERESETTIDSEGNRHRRAMRVYDTDGKLISKPNGA